MQIGTYTTGNNPINYNQSSFFTYDIEGNVDTLVQDYGNGSITASKNMMNTSGNRFKQMIYRYDLVSGKVTDVGYQMHYPDQFYHHYDYDAENRLIDAQTSTDSVYWETDARYSYYKHGPLARTVLGEQEIQGIDYAYTLQGWLKGVNASSLNPAFDIGLDGDTASSNPNKYVAADQYGFNLNYFTGDYKPIASSLVPFPGVSAKLNNEYKPLYNGNISSMAVNLGPLYPGYAEQIWEGPLLYNYTYDQLNRLTAMKAYYGLNEATNVWDTVAYTPSYHEKVTYDPNGNITKYIRNNGHYAAGTTDGAPMDSLFYNYNAGTNQLNQVRDLVTAWPAGYYYLHDQPVNNYGYDVIGNIIKDSIQSLSKIAWNVYGKITEIDHASPPTWNESKTIYYYYDASGNRIGKKVTQGNNKNANYSWYVRDASGNVMSSYTMTGDSTVAQSTLTLNQEYHYMYGSGRLGMHSVFSAVNAADNGTSAYSVPWAGQYYGWRRSKKYYELTNHLGNVMMTLSDSKAGVKQTSNSSLIDHYTALKLTETDYYPFGMQMQERTSSTFTSNYRYGFNGQQQDDEIKGVGNSYNSEFWEYDPRLARRSNLDPVSKGIGSPYATFGNNPINMIDPTGLDTLRIIGGKNNSQWDIIYGTGKAIHSFNLNDYALLPNLDIGKHTIDLTGLEQPDAIGIDISGAINAKIFGGQAGVNLLWHTRGDNNTSKPEVHVYDGAGAGANGNSLGAGVSASVILGYANRYDKSGQEKKTSEETFVANGYNWTGNFWTVSGSLNIKTVDITASRFWGYDPSNGKPKDNGVYWSGFSLGVGKTFSLDLSTDGKNSSNILKALSNLSGNLQVQHYYLLYGNGQDIDTKTKKDLNGLNWPPVSQPIPDR